MERVTVRLDTGVLADLEYAAHERGFVDRSAAIRQAIRDCYLDPRPPWVPDAIRERAHPDPDTHTGDFGTKTTVRVTQRLAAMLERVARSHRFDSESAAIRAAIRTCYYEDTREVSIGDAEATRRLTDELAD